MTTVSRELAIIHRQRAEQLIAGMRLLADDAQAYTTAVCLLAVHAAICFTDSVLVAYTGKRPSEQDHRASASSIRRLCGKMRREEAGVQHLERLLGRKSDFAYGDRAIPVVDAQNAALAATRYQAWIYRTFQELERGS